eukprot:3408724-Pyramimonas_sp.AAC.1
MEHEYKELHDKVWLRGQKGAMTPYGGYALALRRNAGHAGGQTTLAMIAADELRGGFSLASKRMVYAYEHKAALAIRFRSLVAYEHMDACPIQVHQLRMDATHQQAIDKDKIHVAMASTLGC